MTSLEIARAVIARCLTEGVTEFAVCSGSRNSPLLVSLSGTAGVSLYSFVDERSAAFFALGAAKRSRNPVAVVTTSGTAAAELLPAAIEAHYSGLPLVLITADRPARDRGTGAPQSIEQPGLFGRYAVGSFGDWTRRGALHLNVELDEPLLDETDSGEKPEIATPARSRERHDAAPLSSGLRRSTGFHRQPAAPEPGPFRNPLLLVGGLRPGERAAVADALLRVGAPVYAEPLSGLREEPRLADLLITGGERMLARGDFDAVIRVGDVPVARFWRDLDGVLAHLPVVHFSSLAFPGLTRGQIQPLDQLAPFAVRIARSTTPEQAAFLASDRAMAARIAEVLESEPRSELALVSGLSRLLPAHSRLYLGNSLPIREWDLVASREPRGIEMAANRGANGIDGQLSTFLGWCEKGGSNVALIGDLTAIYDLNAPWIVSQLDPGIGFQIVILNNGGGRIFSRVPALHSVPASIRETLIENVHARRFRNWAAMWDLHYEQYKELPPALPASQRGVIELLPDEEASRRAWARYDALWT